MFSHGLYGLEQDADKALTWFKRAAKKKHANAQWRLGYMYLNGIGVDQDFSAALSWLRKAAKQNNSAALFYLAELYEKGHGVPVSDVQALSLYKKAAEQGFHAAEIKVVFAYLNGELGARRLWRCCTQFHTLRRSIEPR